MDSIVFILISAVGLCLATFPCMGLLYIPNLFFSPKWYVPFIWLGGLSMLLAMLTAIVINLELEAGVFSVGIFLIAVSCVWAFIILPIFFIYKWVTIRGRCSNT
ncbi:hypothetical protein [Thalassomonas sp. RHCl1]|uniref:hypothetical protein n=1 Tax=Thalassomonas sp. RHCl1 TaxID=2995320 RepID=UPI00248D12F7|nr:hypothetical protein [Thalassomonas sp. RHCl1]